MKCANNNNAKTRTVGSDASDDRPTRLSQQNELVDGGDDNDNDDGDDDDDDPDDALGIDNACLPTCPLRDAHSVRMGEFRFWIVFGTSGDRAHQPNTKIHTWR